MIWLNLDSRADKSFNLVSHIWEEVKDKYNLVIWFNLESGDFSFISIDRFSSKIIFELVVWLLVDDVRMIK